MFLAKQTTGQHKRNCHEITGPRATAPRQLVEWYIDGCRIGSSIRTVPTPGETVPVNRTHGGLIGRFTVVSVEPSVHPSTGRPPRVAACHLTPLPEPSGGQGETPPSPGDPA